MSIFFTDHARARMVERGITEEMVRETIRRPVSLRESGIRNTRILSNKVGGRNLEVVVSAVGRHIRVVTLYWI